MDNIGEVLKANGLTFDDVFKCTVMLAHMFNRRGCIQQNLCDVFQAGAFARAIRVWR